MGDAKAGAGLYVFATGAAYLGAYAGGRREGRGLLALRPDEKSGGYMVQAVDRAPGRP